MKDVYDLTTPQKSILLTEEFYGKTNLNNVCGTFYSTEKIDFKTLKKALNVFLKNNDSFKIKLKQIDGEIKQYFSDMDDIDFEIVKVKNKEEQTALEEKMASETFNLYESLLFKIVIFKYPDDHGGFVINSHHIISDSWTNGIVANDVALIYSKLKNNKNYSKDESLSYKKYIESEQSYVQSSKYEKDKLYWEDVFNTVPEVASIPSIKNISNDQDSLEAKRLLIPFNDELFSKINNYCQDKKVSLYNFFMAIYSLYIGRVSGLDEFVIGTPILNRTNFKEKQTTGMFINTLPLKINLVHEKTFSENLKEITSRSMALLRHQKYSFQNIIEDLRKKEPNLPKLYNVLYSYQITKMNENMDALEHTTSWTFNKSISDDLDIHMFEWNEEGSIKATYDYKVNKYNEQDILDFHARILYVINQVIENKDILLKDIEIVTPEEKHKLLYEFNNTKVDYPKDKTIVNLFEEQVKKTPDNIAVVFEGQKLTYKELNEKANSLANILQTKNVKYGDIIGVCLKKGIDLIVSIFGILKCGAVYMPMYTKYPKERLSYMVSNSRAKYIIVNSNSASLLDENNIINISDLDFNIDSKNAELNINSNNLAYIIYTSGSTGKPKGVKISHINLINFIYSFNKYYKNNISSKDNFLSSTNMAFDVSIWEIFMPLLNGSTLVFNTEEIINDISLYCKNIIKNNITALYIPPNILNEVHTILNKNNYTGISKLLVGVESITNTTLNKFIDLNPNITIVNGYGPTETTICATALVYNKDIANTHIVPIGKPLYNNHVYILSNNNLCPINIPGELYVSGDGVGSGYLNDNSKTKLAFKKDLFFDNMEMYSTGDTAYIGDDYNIHFVGRKDNQIKLHGYRIELNEINFAITSHPQINKSYSMVFNNSIVAYYTFNKKILATDIKQFLKNKLPFYMIPNFYIYLDKFPLTVNGKIDTKSLPLPNELLSTTYVAPSTKIENLLCDIWCELFSKEKVSIRDNFFELGGDSLTAIKFQTKLLEQDIKINYDNIFNNPTIEQLAKHIETTINSNIGKINIESSEKHSYYKLSSAQKRIYYSCLKDNDSPLYNIAGGIILDNEIDKENLENCFKLLIKRHSSLRTHFENRNEDIVQIIDDSVPFSLEYEEINSDDINSVYLDFVKPFELSKAPLFKTKLIKLKNKKELLLLNMHHIISDGTSLNILLQELCSLYNGKKLQDKEIEYKDFAIWEQEYLKSKEIKIAKDYWVNQFKDEIPLLNMPTIYPRPNIQSYEGSNYFSKIDSSIYSKIANTAKNLNVTPYMLLLSAYYILLSKYTSQDDIVIGSPIIGRQLSETFNTLGMFVNTLPIRNKVDDSHSFLEFCNTVKRNSLEAFKYQAYPFDMLTYDLEIKRDTNRNPIFDTMFVYQNDGYQPINFEGIKSQYFIPNNPISKFDLSLEIVPMNGEYDLRFEYCTKLFNEDFIKRLSSHYLNILNAILQNNNIKIADIDMLSEEEKNKILYDFNNTKLDYPKDKTIIELFEEQVKKTPDKTCIIFEDQKLTYNEVNEKANQIARYFLDNNISEKSVVGIFLPRCTEMLIYMLAILKIKCTYLLIDTALPEDRILNMLEQCNAQCLITSMNFNKINFNNKLFMEDFVYTLSSENLNLKVNPNSPSCIVFTSGSTGTPKGIILTHLGINNMVHNYKKNLNIDICSSILSISSVAFDMFIVETYISLLTGKTLILSNDEQQKIPTLMHDLIKKHSANFILTTPSRLELMLSQNLLDDLDCIKIIQLGGEIFTADLYSRITKITSANIYNGYGPSEITACCSNKYINNSNITIGKPFDNFKIYIMDKNNLLCPIGVPGEICISGDGVSLGYINRPDLTKKVFIKSPFNDSILYKTGDLGIINSNGELEYIGRIDNQIKIRGLRVELSEIETQLQNMEFINNCAVIYKKEEASIIAFIVSNSGKVNISNLREILKLSLPLYMVPKYIVQLDELPITINGKLDKKALYNYKIDVNQLRNIEKPTTYQEKICCKIWEELLGIEIGITDNIFEFGADSLLAIKFKTQMLANNINIPYSDIFKYPTIKELCNKSQIISNIKIDDYDYTQINKLLEQNNIKHTTYVNNRTNNNILLVGSNGFVGMHIIYSFIKNDSGNIYCMVRDKNKKSAYNRFLDILHFYFGTELDKYINKRIFILKGNVLKENFDLSNTNIELLNESIDIVINAAALVKHYGNEKTFFDINVGSTKIAINYCHNFNKRLIHISSLSVSGNDSLVENTSKDSNTDSMSFTENNLYIGQNLDNLYIKSKFESEKLILENITNKKINAQIIRLGNITNRYSDGKFQIHPNTNAFYNRLKTLINIGYIPNNLLSSYVEFTPVDICSDVIVLLMQNYVKSFTVFHVYNNNHVYINKLLDYLNALNIKMKQVSIEEFTNIINSILENNSINIDGIINDFDNNKMISYNSNIKIYSEFTRMFLYLLNFSWPSIDIEYLRKYFKYMNLI